MTSPVENAFDDVSSDVQSRLQNLMEDVSLAQHILRATTSCIPLTKKYYHPMIIPHMSDEYNTAQYGLTNVQARTYLMYHAINNKTDRTVRDTQTAIDTLRHGTSAQTDLWHQCKKLYVPVSPSHPPAHAARFIGATLQAHQMWFHVSCLLQLSNQPLDPQHRFYRYIP